MRKRGSAGFVGSAQKVETLRCPGSLHCPGCRGTAAFHGITPCVVQTQGCRTARATRTSSAPSPALPRRGTSPVAHPVLPRVQENTSWGAGKDLSPFPPSPAGPGSCLQVSERGTEGSDGMKGPLWSPPAHKSWQLTALLMVRLPFWA